MALLEVNTINSYYGNIHALKDLSFEVNEGEIVSLIGANGAGKSTFLKILSGDIETTSGSVSLDENKRIAVLKQDQFAYEDKSVLETVIMGHKELYDIYAERAMLYAKPELTDDEGLRVGDSLSRRRRGCQRYDRESR